MYMRTGQFGKSGPSAGIGGHWGRATPVPSQSQRRKAVHVLCGAVMGTVRYKSGSLTVRYASAFDAGSVFLFGRDDHSRFKVDDQLPFRVVLHGLDFDLAIFNFDF